MVDWRFKTIKNTRMDIIGTHTDTGHVRVTYIIIHTHTHMNARACKIDNDETM